MPLEVWADRPHDPEIRRRLTEIVIDCAYAKGSDFNPDDPFELMMVLRYGDLNEREIMIDIEREYGVEFTEELINWLIDEKVTFLQFIHYIQQNRLTSNSST